MLLIDAEQLQEDGWKMERLRKYDQYCVEWEKKKPTEFAEAVVRCEKCAFYKHRTCTRFGIRLTRKPEDFCSEGMARDG